MEKQNFKEALKNAKVCFRQDPTHEHRQILERSWLARGLQLARAGLQAEGRAAAQELLAMGVSQPDVQQGFPELLLAVGLYDQAVASGKIRHPVLGVGGGQEADAAVLARAADRAVADPASAPTSLAGIREGAVKVRAALDALYAGDGDAALAGLGEVPRNSPFADWKLFIRGLAAYYRHDDEAMRTNWDRLGCGAFRRPVGGAVASPGRSRLEHWQPCFGPCEPGGVPPSDSRFGEGSLRRTGGLVS